MQDKVLLEILKNRFQSIADEMAYNMLRSGHTVFIKETGDFGTALASPQGELFTAPGELGISVICGIPLHAALDAVDGYEPGDVILANDPYTTKGLSTHLPDFFVWKPIFHEGQLICFATGFIHSSDVGGIVPGSISPASTDIFQEGIRIPPVKLYKAGQPNKELFQIITANSRIPEQNWGDVHALVGAMNLAENRIHDLIARYGVDIVNEAIPGVLDYAEQETRAIIASLPDGNYKFSDYMEGDVAGGEPVRICLRMEISGDEMLLDFSGTDPQVQSSMNLPTFGHTGHYMLMMGLVNYFRTKKPSIPANSGVVRPVKVDIPKGSLLNPHPPAACGIRAATMFRIVEMTMACLNQADPHNIPSAGCGQLSIILMACIDPRSGEHKVSVAQPLSGGSGARTFKDGIDGTDFSSILRNIPNEVLETDMPVVVERYGLRRNSGGAGRFRGGHGIEFRFKNLAPAMTLTARGLERYLFRPWGREGSNPGSLGETLLNPGTPNEKSIGKITVLQIEAGDVLFFRTPAGGGWGPALDRNPEEVAADVRAGLIPGEAAEQLYGVVFNGEGEPDLKATHELRQSLKAAGEPHSATDRESFVLGLERDTYEAVWSDELRAEIKEALDQIPTVYRALISTKTIQYIKTQTSNQKQITPVDVKAYIHSNWDDLKQSIHFAIDKSTNM